MKEILFATGNQRKIKEAREGCAPYGIEVVQIKLDIDEIQSSDPLVIAQDKAQKAFTQANAPITISDTSWTIPALNGFPGGYMKDVANWFTAQDFLNLMIAKTDRQVIFTESVIYHDQSGPKVFSRGFPGTITMSPRGGGISIEQVAEFDGFTLGERRDQGATSHKPEDYVWADFAKWFSSQ